MSPLRTLHPPTDKVCMPEEYLNGEQRRRGLEEKEEKGIAKDEVIPEEHRVLLSNPTPQTCYDVRRHASPYPS